MAPLVGGQALVVATGLASAAIEAAGFWFALVVAIFACFVLALVAVPVGDLLLLRNLHRALIRQGGTVSRFETKRLPAEPDAMAPDGSDVRVLLGLRGGSMAHFELPPGHTATAVTHRTVEEIWFFLSGRGEMWRKMDNYEEIVSVEAGVCITITLGTHFQFRAFADEPLAAVGVTMPPWPGKGEATVVEGKWSPTLP